MGGDNTVLPMSIPPIPLPPLLIKKASHGPVASSRNHGHGHHFALSLHSIFSYTSKTTTARASQRALPLAVPRTSRSRESGTGSDTAPKQSPLGSIVEQNGESEIVTDTGVIVESDNDDDNDVSSDGKDVDVAEMDSSDKNEEEEVASQKLREVIVVTQTRLRHVDQLMAVGQPERNPAVCLLPCNLLHTLDGIRTFSALRKLDAHSNCLTSLPDAESVWGAVPHLQVLLLHNNMIEGSLDGLICLKKLILLTLYGNPVAKDSNYRSSVVNQVTWLIALDNWIVSDEERIDGNFPPRFRKFTEHLKLNNQEDDTLQLHSSRQYHNNRLDTEIRSIRRIWAQFSPIVLIQRWLRRHRLWRAIRERLRRHDEGALRLQWLVRHAHERQKRGLAPIPFGKGVDLATSLAALRIQNAYRRRVARIRNKKEEKAARVIQRAVRHWIARRVVLERELATQGGGIFVYFHEAVGKNVRVLLRKMLRGAKSTIWARCTSTDITVIVDDTKDAENAHALEDVKKDVMLESRNFSLKASPRVPYRRVSQARAHIRLRTGVPSSKERQVWREGLAKNPSRDRRHCTAKFLEKCILSDSATLQRFREVVARFNDAFWKRKVIITTGQPIALFTEDEVRQRTAALSIQKWWRAWHGVRRITEEQFDCTTHQRAVICLQRWWRWWVLRKRLRLLAEIKALISAIDTKEVYLLQRDRRHLANVKFFHPQFLLPELQILFDFDELNQVFCTLDDATPRGLPKWFGLKLTSTYQQDLDPSHTQCNLSLVTIGARIRVPSERATPVKGNFVALRFDSVSEARNRAALLLCRTWDPITSHGVRLMTNNYLSARLSEFYAGALHGTPISRSPRGNMSLRIGSRFGAKTFVDNISKMLASLPPQSGGVSGRTPNFLKVSMRMSAHRRNPESECLDTSRSSMGARSGRAAESIRRKARMSGFCSLSQAPFDTLNEGSEGEEDIIPKMVSHELNGHTSHTCAGNLRAHTLQGSVLSRPRIPVTDFAQA